MRRPPAGQGYVHNDIKPLNILYGPPGSECEKDAHLLDFGMASCHAGSEEVTSHHITHTADLSAGLPRGTGGTASW